jgi:hypothetical protein
LEAPSAAAALGSVLGLLDAVAEVSPAAPVLAPMVDEVLVSPLAEVDAPAGAVEGSDALDDDAGLLLEP